MCCIEISVMFHIINFRFNSGQDVRRILLRVNTMNEYNVLLTFSPVQLVRKVIARGPKREATTALCGKSIRLVAFQIMHQTYFTCNSSTVLPEFLVQEYALLKVDVKVNLTCYMPSSHRGEKVDRVWR